MVGFHLWLQVHLLVYFTFGGHVCVCARVLFQQHMPEWGTGDTCARECARVHS